MQQDIPDSLIRSFQRREVILFVGSGASVDASLPSWVSLLELLARSIPTNSRGAILHVRQHLEQGHFLDVADYLRSVLSRAELFTLLERALCPTNHEPGRIHRAIVSLPAAGLVTTNYDRLLERADVNQQFGSPFTWMDQALAVRVGKRFLFKAHGSLDEPHSLILASADYDRIQDHNAQYNAFLRTILSPPYRALFVGYGFRDPDLNLLLRQIDQSWNSWNNPPVALFAVPDPLEPDPIVDVMLRGRLHVEPIYIATSGDQGTAVCDWLQALKSTLEPAQSPGKNFSLPAPMQIALVAFFAANFSETRKIASRFPTALGEPSDPEQLAIWLESVGRDHVRSLVRELRKRWPMEPILKDLAVFLPPD